MATLLMHRAPRAFALGLGISSAFATSALVYRAHSRPLLCDSATQQSSGIFRTYQQDAKTPVVKDGSVNPAIFRQVSSGSILGLMGGVAVSMFSKTLTFLIGISIAGIQVSRKWLASRDLQVFWCVSLWMAANGIQYLESRGISIVPTSKIQRYFKNIDIKSAVQDNMAFKICFGTTFALAAFAEF